MLKTAVITDEISQDLQVACDLACKYHLDGIEIRSVWDKGPHKLSDSDIRNIRDIANKANLSVCGISAPFFKCELDSDSEIAEQFEILDRCIHLAKELNCSFIRGFTFWAKGDYAANLPKIVSKIQDASKRLDGTGITLVIEMDPSVYAGNAARVAEVVRAVDRPNVRALFDPGNLVWNYPNAEVPFPDAYDTLKPYISHVHVKDATVIDGKPDAVKVGTGDVDFAGLFARLVKDGYDGYVVLETHYRLAKEISAELLALPGGAEFSDGAFPATDESLASMCEILSKIQ
ncbi:MAG: sugar phosphate isomerase/epimerase family protein [Clostridia bacterium]